MFANMWYYGLEEGISSIRSEQGFQQGDPTSSWSSAVIIQPLLLSLQQCLAEQGYIKFYVDDGNIGGELQSNAHPSHSR